MVVRPSVAFIVCRPAMGANDSWAYLARTRGSGRWYWTTRAGEAARFDRRALAEVFCRQWEKSCEVAIITVPA